jgi:demethylmenaquinone methyltransferase / 2-methoxy-6-polyprenyl-1,4-benzoquinol methylase
MVRPFRGVEKMQDAQSPDSMQDAGSSQSGESRTHFGYSEVPLGDKQGLVDDVFHKVAQRYDVMNDLMSGGLHRVWKDVLVRKIRPSRRGPFKHLDVAGGTGDVAFRVARAGGPQTRVTVLDINGDMLGVGRERAEKKGLSEQLTFVEANAEDLPFPDDEFDAYTIAFGIRNVPRIEQALAEAYRTLKRGGRFLCLEFSQVEAPFLAKIYESYSFSMIPLIGRLVAGEAEPYRYLVESIRQFPPAEEFAAMIEKAGFQRVGFTRLTGGIVAIHSGWKL